MKKDFPKIKLYYVGKRLNGNALVHAYTETLPTPLKNGKFFNSVTSEKLIMFSKKLLGYESIGHSLLTLKTETGVKSPYEITPDKAPKELITFWSTQELTDTGKHKMRKKTSEKLDGDVALLIQAIKEYSPSRRSAAIQALIKLL